MKIEKFFKYSAIVATAVLTIGCTSNPPEPKPTVTEKPTAQKPKPVVKEETISLSEIDGSGMDKISITGGGQEYKVGEPISFTIDTGDMSGYIYLIYLDSKDNVGILYPDENTPLVEMTGTLKFPEDFNSKLKLKATKDCQGCDKDKTVIYAFLSKKPIKDIHSITKQQLLQIGGEIKTKGFVKEHDNSSKSSVVTVGKTEILVK